LIRELNGNGGLIESRVSGNVATIAEEVDPYAGSVLLALDLYKMVSNDNRARAEAEIKAQANQFSASIGFKMEEISDGRLPAP
jgi:hypothetical protein